MSLQEAYKMQMEACGPQFQHLCQFCGLGWNMKASLQKHMIRKHRILNIPSWRPEETMRSLRQTDVNTGQFSPYHTLTYIIYEK